MKQIYEDARYSSEMRRGWYWASIKTKRVASLFARSAAFALLVFGTGLPLLSALSDDANHRLLCTQIAISLLAVAGLIQLADKSFGWSSGWMRYITTVTSMESVASNFELAWAKHLITRGNAIDDSDVWALYSLAEQMERDLIGLQNNETSGWITEFNAGIGVLDSAIRSQRDETQRQLETIRAESKAAIQAAKEERESAAPGALDVVLSFTAGPKAVAILIDGDFLEKNFFGTSFSKIGLSPGIHTVELRDVVAQDHRLSFSVVIEPRKISRLEARIPF